MRATTGTIVRGLSDWVSFAVPRAGAGFYVWPLLSAQFLAVVALRDDTGLMSATVALGTLVYDATIWSLLRLDEMA
jgi:hypothetical protein